MYLTSGLQVVVKWYLLMVFEVISIVFIDIYWIYGC